VSDGWPQAADHRILDRIADACFAVDDQWRFTYLNEAAARLFDSRRHQLRGQVIWDEFPETVETQFPDGFYQAMETQDPVTFEVFHTPLETWFEVRAFPSEDGISVYLQDITDEKRRQKELVRYEAVVENAHDGVVVVDAQNRIRYANDALARALGASPNDLVGRHVDVAAEIADIDADELAELGHALDVLRAGNARFRQFEFPYVLEDGTEKVAELRLVPLEDGTASVAGVARDITDRYEHERVVESLNEVSRQLFGAEDEVEIASIVVHALSEILDLRINGVWLLDDEMGCLDPIAGSAGAYDELGGLPRFQEGQGLVWDAFREDEPVVYEDVSQVDGVYNENTVIRGELIVPMGSHGVLMSGSLEPRRFDETDLDLVSTLAATAEAALDRADRENLLRERKQVLGRQSERLDAVSAVIDRDVRDRLGDAIDALASESEATRKLVQADALLDDVLEFAHGRASIGPRERVRIDDAVADAARRQPTADVDGPKAATLRADPERFGRLLSALFGAAAERAEDRVPISVSVLEAPERGFEVVDEAPADGVEPERVFQVGYDAEGGSAGLGLPIAREIAEAHGWRIEFDDDDASGTRVVVHGITTLEATD
jgi:PAS domain S-box-containing protein